MHYLHWDCYNCHNRVSTRFDGSGYLTCPRCGVHVVVTEYGMSDGIPEATYCPVVTAPAPEEPEVTIFRMDPPAEGGACFALFPYAEGSPGHCMCYQHIGQHSSADYTGCIQRSRPALPHEYADLKAELESIGYKLDIHDRLPPRYIRRPAYDRRPHRGTGSPEEAWLDRQTNEIHYTPVGERKWR